MMKNGTLLLCALAVTANIALAQSDFASVEVRAQKVQGNVYMLTGEGGNIGVSAGPDGILIVDDQFAPLADKIRAALKGINSGRLKFIVNTHYHGDHTGGNKVFGADAPIIAQSNVRKRLITGETRGTQIIPPAPKEAWPVVTFDQSVSIHFNGEEIKVIHFPHGHTDGDSVIFFTASRVVHLGDDFLAGGYPGVDIASGGSLDGLIRNIAEIISQTPPDAVVIPGHGPVSTLDDLRAYREMLVETTGIVRKKMAGEETLEEIQREGLGPKWKGWGAGYVGEAQWIATIYRSGPRRR